MIKYPKLVDELDVTDIQRQKAEEAKKNQAIAEWNQPLSNLEVFETKFKQSEAAVKKLKLEISRLKKKLDINFEKRWSDAKVFYVGPDGISEEQAHELDLTIDVQGQHSWFSID